MRRLLYVVAVVVALGSGCQLRLAVDVAVQRGGSGRLELTVVLDRELASLLRDAGMEPLAGLREVAAHAPGWRVHADQPPGGEVRVRLHAGFDGPQQFSAVTDSLHAALDEGDPRLFERLRLQRRAGGGVAFEGRAGLQLPVIPGARGVGVRFDADDLRRLIARRGDELVRYDLRVSLPAPPREHNADQVDGATLLWCLPVSTMREVRAVSGRPATVPLPGLVAAGLTAATAAALAVVVVRLRRHGR